MPPNDAAAVAIAARDFSYDTGASGDVFSRAVAVEAPVAIQFGGVGFAVMMASPRDLEDFAYGFALTEGIIGRAADIRAVETGETAAGLTLNIALAGDKMSAHLGRQRALAGRTGCGLCGIDDLAHLPALRRVALCPPVAPAAIRASIKALDGAQALNAATRAVHAAGWFDRQGALIALREDVGRHNALDKLIGALIRQNAAPEEGFFVITSRCSFEMVAKAAVFGAATLVALSAPTSLALERAAACGVTLIALARADHATVFAQAAADDGPSGDEGLAA